MKKSKRFWLLSLLAIFLFLLQSVQAQKESYEQLWLEAQKAADNALPRTALETIEKLRQKAIAEYNSIELIKAGLFQYAQMQSFEEDNLIKSIKLAEAQLDLLKKPEKQLMHSILARLYRFYYQENRFRILEQSVDGGETSADIREWNVTDFRNTITYHYDQSLSAPSAMDSVSLKQYLPLLTKTSAEAFSLQPSLFDFVAAQALDFYRSNDAGLSAFTNEKTKLADWVWESYAIFTTKKLPASDEPKMMELQILQQLLLSNFKNGHTEALINNDLQRFELLRDYLAGQSGTDSLYLDALDQLQKAFSKHESSAQIAATRASYYMSYNTAGKADYTTALKICEEAVEAFPNSRGAAQCQHFKQEITARELSAIVQQVLVPGQPVAVRLSYRNVTNPMLRIARISSESLSRIMEIQNEEARVAAFSQLSPLLDKSLTLPFEPDYKTHSTIIDLPPLMPGLYVLLLSDSPSFKYGNIVTFTSFQVSKLSFVSHKSKGNNAFYLLNRETGFPVAKALIRVMMREYDYTSRQYLTKEKTRLTTDSKGYFGVDAQLIGNNRMAFYVEVMSKGDTLYSDNYFDAYRQLPFDREQTKTWFFTDRSIYRPGQTLHFKGISLKRVGNDAWQTNRNSETTVRLFDASGREIGSKTFTTNEFGSFEGSFELASALLTGTMRIGNESGSFNFLLEEYKRPTFEVSLEVAEKQYKLNQTIEVEGTAKAFSGYGIDSSLVNYRVEARRWYPFRVYGYWFPPYAEENVLLTSGQTYTHRDGTFSISFVASASMPEKTHLTPVYSYLVTAYVVDKNGETRSGTTEISVSDKALILSTNLGEVVNQNRLAACEVKAANLQQMPVTTQLTISIYRIEPKDRLLRKPLWEAVDRQFLSDEKLAALFPYDDFRLKNDSTERKRTPVWSGQKHLMGTGSFFPAEAAQWTEGEYLAVFEATDVYGSKVQHEQDFVLYNPRSKNMPVRQLSWFHLSGQSAQPGDTVHFSLGSAEKANRVLIEIRNNDTLFYHKWHTISNRLRTIPFVIGEEHRGSLRFEAFFIRHNSLQHAAYDLEVPWTNKNLDIRIETKRDKLLPGATETWTLSVKDSKGIGAKTEVLAAMYDASLDGFAAHNWQFDVLPYAIPPQHWQADNGFWLHYTAQLSYPPGKDYSFPQQELPALNWFGLDIERNRWGYPVPMTMQKAAHGGHQHEDVALEMVVADAVADEAVNTERQEQTPLSYLRSDFRETAFFYPQLQTDSSGFLKFTFRLPDALTRWNMMLLAHNNDLQRGYTKTTFTAAKPLMVVPNLPRFFRQGDTALISMKLVNTGSEIISGIARIELTDGITGLGFASKSLPDKPFLNLKPASSLDIQWQVVIGSESSLLAAKFSATAATFTDAEQQYVPVLASGVIVNESQALFVPASSRKTFTIEGLKKNNPAEKNIRLSLSLSSNPAWYAVKALPWLQQTENESSDQLFYAYYANSLAAHTAAGIPEAMKVVETWKKHQPGALVSKLEQDQRLKNILLSETPWIMDAADETQQQQQISLLFDLNRMQYEQVQSMNKLLRQQLPNGAWSWFPGMEDNRGITLEIVVGLGKLHAIGAGHGNTEEAITKALNYLEQEAIREYQRMTDRRELSGYVLNALHLNYLYALSFFDQFQLSPKGKEVSDFLTGHLVSDWMHLSHDAQARAALILLRKGDTATATRILSSLKEKSLSDPLLGRWWKASLNDGNSAQRIEAQAMFIEAFEEAGYDNVWIDSMRQWLLTQKQTNRWETSRATAEAVYALLRRGTNWLAETQSVVVNINGSQPVFPPAEAGTGRFDKEWFGSGIDSSLSVIEISNPNKVMVWGGIHRQFQTEIDAVEASGSNLRIKRELFVEKAGKNATVLIPVDEAGIRRGDRIKVRIVVESDREMEFVHLKDYRAAAFEPLEAVSGYQSAAGHGYYRSSRDTRTDFFFDFLPKGKFVIEYTLVAMQSGSFGHGYCEIQSYYAPEFSGRSQSLRIEVKP